MSTSTELQAISSSSDEVEDIVNGLSRLIRAHLQLRESESTNPQRQADSMDEEIKFHRERVGVLRKLRMEFEDEMARQRQFVF